MLSALIYLIQAPLTLAINVFFSRGISFQWILDWLKLDYISFAETNLVLMDGYMQLFLTPIFNLQIVDAHLDYFVSSFNPNTETGEQQTISIDPSIFINGFKKLEAISRMKENGNEASLGELIEKEFGNEPVKKVIDNAIEHFVNKTEDKLISE